MPLTIVVGGQYGGEGKGAVTAFLVANEKPTLLLKAGGPNSSHTYGSRKDGLRRVRMMPSGAHFGAATVGFPAGSLIHPSTLFNEVRRTGYSGTILIDPKAGIVEARHIAGEAEDTVFSGLGSTRTGVGYAVAERARRRLSLARDEPSLAVYARDIAAEIVLAIEKNELVLVEGSQGHGLSNYHGDYPFVTSRDNGVCTVLSQLGVGPAFLTKSILVLKCFPTRNRHGNSILSTEVDLSNEPELSMTLSEFGGGGYEGGDDIRRVALFDFEVAKSAVRANTPDVVALTGLDRLTMALEHPVVRRHYGSVEYFVHSVQETLRIPVQYTGWGPYIEDVRIRRLGA